MILKACPFCGGEAKMYMGHKIVIGLTLWCECQKCHAKTVEYCPKDDIENFGQCKASVSKAWDRRA